MQNVDKINKFIEYCSNKHNNKYDYSKVSFKSQSEKIEIICKTHGIFTQSVEMHMNGQGCVKCYREVQSKRNTLSQEFVMSKLEESNTDCLFNNVHYVNSSTKINITCKKHGDFGVTYHNFLKGSGCPRCKESKLIEIPFYYIDKIDEYLRYRLCKEE